MRINTSPAQVIGGAKMEPGSDPALANLKKGDSLDVKILSNDKGVVSMKTESGQIIKARLEGDAQLSPGDTATLKITEVSGESIYMSLQAAEDLSVPQRAASSGQSIDKSLAAFAGKLSSLRLPVSREAVEAMRDMLAANPDMTIDEAAFLASNKIPADSKLAQAAKALLTNGVKTDDMVRSMLPLLKGAEDSASLEEGARGKAFPMNQVFPESSGGAPSVAPEGEKAATLIKWLTAVLDSHTAGAAASTSAPVLAAQTEQPSGQSIVPPQASQTEQASGQFAVLPEAETVAAANQAAEAETSASSTPAFQSAKQAVMKILSEIPEFKGTPQEALSEFSERLLGAAVKAGSAPQDSGETEKLKSLLDGLFEKLPLKDEKGGEVIRRAKEDLFMRLTLFEEALKSSDAPSKSALMKETENLLNHVKLQNSIDQFVYMQIPIKLGEENKTAELYVYKQRKGAKNIDPENVSILLALDLEHVGHVESFVKIRGREVSLQTEVPSEDSREFFTENTIKLHEMLKEINFRLAGMNVSCNSGVTTPLTALISLLEHEKGPASGIDYTI